jgi:hypothetical protein
MNRRVKQLPRALYQREVNSNYELSLEEAQKESKQAPSDHAKKLERLKLWLERKTASRQALEGTATMTPITATSRPFNPAPGQGLPLHNTCILASSEIYHCTTCIYAAV